MTSVECLVTHFIPGDRSETRRGLNPPPLRTQSRPQPVFVLHEVKPEKCLCQCHVTHLVQPACMMSSSIHPFKCNSIKRTGLHGDNAGKQCSSAEDVYFINIIQRQKMFGQKILSFQPTLCSDGRGRQVG